MNRTPAPPTVVPAFRSLRWRLPLLICGLVTVILVIFLWAAYRRVEATLIRTAGERAQLAADQIAGLLDGRRLGEQLRQLSVDPELQQFLKVPTDDAREAARARLAALGGAAPRRIEVWNAAGSRVLEVTDTGGSDRAEGARTLPEGDAPSAPGIAPIQGSPEIVFSDIVAEIRETGAAGSEPSSTGRLGYVRIRSTFRESPPGIFNRLVGRDALVRVGNRTGGTWTDFARVLPVPAIDLSRQGVTQYRNDKGELRLGAVSLIPATPWAAWVEFSLANIVAPAGGFLKEMAWTALAVVIGAAIFAVALARRISKPISEINSAAAAVAAGDYSRRVPEYAGDEIGHLGRTFNTMAAEVKTASDALKKSEDSYRRLFASNPHPMWVYDVETLRFLDVNDMAVAHYGYSRDEFLAMTIKDIRPESELPSLLESVNQVSVTALTAGVWKHRKKDGSIIEAEVSSHELILNGRRARIVLPHDVTVERRAQRALRESEARFRGMAETMPQVVWTARPDGERTYYNSRWFDYTGQAKDEALGRGWQAMLHPDDREDTVRQWMHAVQTGGSPTMTYRLRRRDGVYRWHVGRAAPLRNESGDIMMWVGTATDIDDARRGQEMLETLNAELEQRVRARTAELEAANQELEAFSYSVSHDLRAPLRHVQGYVEMLSRAAEGQLSEQSRRYLTIIKDATVEMGNLIDDLLSFSRMARIHMSEGGVSLDDLVRETIAGLELSTRGRDITWQLSPLPSAIGDVSMLKQVFANLIGNAVKYTSGRAQARIEIGCDGEEDGRRIFFVRDNGAGFDMRYAHKLFGVFQRLHRADEFEGTGIGLATVRRIISRHGGRTWAEGQVNQGATFYFTLRTEPGRH